MIHTYKRTYLEHSRRRAQRLQETSLRRVIHPQPRLAHVGRQHKVLLRPQQQRTTQPANSRAEHTMLLLLLKMETAATVRGVLLGVPFVALVLLGMLLLLPFLVMDAPELRGDVEGLARRPRAVIGLAGPLSLVV